MRHWKQINTRQLAILRKVGGGDDLSHEDAFADRRSAGALHDRGLLIVTKRDGWRAAITDAGRYYLAHGHHPNDPAVASVTSHQTPHSAPAPEATAGGAGTERHPAEGSTGSVTRPRRAAPHRTVRIAAERRAAALDLLATLAENGSVDVERPDDAAVDQWRQVIDFAKRNNLVPAGKRLVKSRPYGRDLHVELVDGAHPNSRPDPAQRPQIVVATEVDQLHRLLRTPQGHRLAVSSHTYPRAQRLLHALVTTAVERGHSVGWAAEHGGVLTFTVGGHAFELTLREEYDDHDVVPDPDALTGTTYSWQRVQPHTRSVPTARLRLELTTGYEYRGRPRTWADRTRWSLEDKLGEVLAELEARSRIAQQRERDKQEAHARQRREWERAMHTARQRFVDDQRIAALNQQVQDWEQARRIRAYCAALEATSTEPDLAGTVSGWVAWCRAYAERLDPVGRDDLEPDEVEPRKEDLRPYLDRFSPYGPDERW